MKTLKKSLCLILALVMVLGLCTIAVGAADYTDAAEIKYTAANDIMSQLGILVGIKNADGTYSFKPDDIVTRAQAAKMIAYMILGKDNAEKMPTTASFTDVNPGDWYAKYVGFCAKQGIINGKVAADGSLFFDPDAPVTGTELAKMILCAVGFGKAGEYVGSGWDFNAVADALTYGVYSGTLSTDFEAGATRDECALYVRNGMFDVPIQSYANGVYAPALGTQTYAQKVWKFNDMNGIIVANKKTGALDTMVDFGTTQAAVKFDTDLDMIGHEVRVLFKGSVATTPAPAITVDKTYSLTDVSTVVKVGEKTALTPVTYKGWDNYSEIPAASLAAPGGLVSGGKALLDLIVAGNKIVGYKVADSYELAKVTVVATDGKITIANKNSYTVAATSTSDAYTWILDGTFAVGDFVKVQKIGAMTLVSPTEKLDDVLISKQALVYGIQMFNGIYTTTTQGSTEIDGVTAPTLAVGTTYTLYLDGNAVFAATEKAGPAATKSYVYFVKGFDAKVDATYDDQGMEITAATTVHKAQVITDEGEAKYIVVTADMKGTAEGFYEASYNASSGVYTLNTVSSYTAADKLHKIDNISAPFVNVSKLTGCPYFIDENTKIIVKNNKTLKDLVVTVSQPGLLNGDFIGKNAYFTLEPIVGSTAFSVKSVWISGEENTAAVADSYIYLNNTTATGTELNGFVTVSTYTVYIDGEMGSIVLTNTDVATTGAGFYTYVNNENGTYTLKDKVPAASVKTLNIGAAGDITLFGGMITASGAFAALDGNDISDLAVVDTRIMPANPISSVAGLAALTTETVSLTFMVDYYGAPFGVIYVGAAG